MTTDTDTLREAKAILRKALPDLNAAAIPTKSEVFVLCGRPARDLHDAIEAALATLSKPELPSGIADLRDRLRNSIEALGEDGIGSNVSMSYEFANDLLDALSKPEPAAVGGRDFRMLPATLTEDQIRDFSWHIDRRYDREVFPLWLAKEAYEQALFLFGKRSYASPVPSDPTDVSPPDARTVVEACASVIKEMAEQARYREQIGAEDMAVEHGAAADALCEAYAALQSKADEIAALQSGATQ